MSYKPRTILTTDMECDDMNSIIHLLLYVNEIKLDGIVYTSSQYHFTGDGVHTLGEVTPNYRCSGAASFYGHVGKSHPGADAKDMKSYRAFEKGWIEELIDKDYRAVYPHLVSNDPAYPTPEYLLSITKYGNIEFEGDVRYETEGSKLIEDAIMDDNDETLYLQSWGGFNTIARALMSIHEKYHTQDNYEEIYQKVVKKVVVFGVMNEVGQDNSYLDYIRPIFPTLKCMRGDYGYGGFMTSIMAPLQYQHMFKAEWYKKNIKFNHGPLLARYGLMGDGTVYPNEPDRKQFGLNTTMDWGHDGMPGIKFDKYDHLGEGDSSTYVMLFDRGLRGLTENPMYGTLLGRLYRDGKPLEKTSSFNMFERGYQEEFACRAEWCIKDHDECNHAPVVEVETPTIIAKPGMRVDFKVKASDPDGDQLRYLWHFYKDGSNYHGTCNDVDVYEPLDLSTSFVIPYDSKIGDVFNFVVEVKDHAEYPLTRYGQVIVKVL